MVHPLTTEAVTYIVQRAESLMGLFFLLTVYCFVRSADGEPAGSGRWKAASVLCCLLGMGTKEVMAVAPVGVLLFDRTFVAKSWRQAWQAGRGYYLSLAATWLPLAFLVAGNGGDRGGTSGFHVGVSWTRYWLSQGEAMALYLKLALWPRPLVIDYGPPSAPIWLAVMLLVGVAVVVIVTALGCWRGRPWAFLTGICLLVLAPTSVMPGVLQFVAEHRFYLPLAAVVAAVVFGGVRLANRWTGSEPWRGRVLAGLLILAIGGMAMVTARRSLDYRSDLALWLETVAQRPQNALAQANVGEALLIRGRLAEAIPYCVKATSLDPMKPMPHYNLGLAYEEEKRLPEALEEFETAARIKPKLFYAEFHAGRILERAGRPAEAERMLRAGLTANPTAGGAHADLGLVLADLGRPIEAMAEDRRALELDPGCAAAETNWGAVLAKTGDLPGAEDHFRRSLAIEPDQPETQFDWGIALARAGRLEAAAQHYGAAARLKPTYADAQLNLGVSLAQLGRVAEALPALQAAVRLGPDSAPAHANLATALDQLDRTTEAVEEYRRALQLNPGYAEAHYNLGNALIRLHRPAEAREDFVQALAANPSFAAAREMLDRLSAFSSAH